ncbi:MAG: HdeD family acid-resistance protein [Sphingomonas sp.]|uniref:HdeD family acid-resistance protein n=1 Tax=Sphingomonas sp. TaxID=28214 RepID=UPI00227517FA|nr:HdeD family acid-resistance protein [Sphingomonas sp.]MCX8477161.1 HdeD family acid-resistance protein [Sphingomonas sp.]
MSDTISSPTADPVPRRSFWRRTGSALLGLAFIVCGAFAILVPMLSTLAMTFTVGIALVAAGIAQIGQAFSRSWGGLFLHVLLGLLYIGAGIIFFRSPLSGALVLTAMLAWLLIVQGIGEIVMAFTIKRRTGWLWLVVSGVLSTLLGFWLLFWSPSAGLFVPGIVLGMALLVEGCAFLVIGTRAGPQEPPGPATAASAT